MNMWLTLTANSLSVQTPNEVLTHITPCRFVVVFETMTFNNCCLYRDIGCLFDLFSWWRVKVILRPRVIDTFNASDYVKLWTFRKMKIENRKMFTHYRWMEAGWNKKMIRRGICFLLKILFTFLCLNISLIYIKTALFIFQQTTLRSISILCMSDTICQFEWSLEINI